MRGTKSGADLKDSEHNELTTGSQKFYHATKF